MAIETGYKDLLLNKNPEILIDWFDEFLGENEFKFLSNFYTGSPFTWKNDIWKTSEHAYAAMKSDNYADFKAIRDCDTPDEAKYIGRNIEVREDWEEIKYSVMHSIVLAKFTSGVNGIGDKLLSTGNAYLQEGTFWNDKVWGVDLIESEHPDRPMARKGNNWLGIILMDVRSRLKYWHNPIHIISDANWTSKR